jgi:prepilin-type N-terminal cleavage/methylation domain-containing protein
MCTRRNKKKGFTLVELSIVLIIIGLIVSGVLVGQDLINAARLRSTIQQLEGYQTAVNTFTLKFDALAGDADADNVSNTVIEGAAAGSIGNGTLDDVNGTTAGTTGTYLDSVAAASELTAFWNHLSTNGMIQGSFAGTAITDVPDTKLGTGAWGVFGLSGANYFYLGLATDGTFAEILTPLQARDVDNKLDNGLPMTGVVTAVSSTTAADLLLTTVTISDMNHTDAATDGECTNTDASPVYNITNGETVACQIRIEMN